jgi:hypothetical protein
MNDANLLPASAAWSEHQLILPNIGQPLPMQSASAVATGVMRKQPHGLRVLRHRNKGNKMTYSHCTIIDECSE